MGARRRCCQVTPSRRGFADHRLTLGPCRRAVWHCRPDPAGCAVEACSCGRRSRHDVPLHFVGDIDQPAGVGDEVRTRNGSRTRRAPCRAQARRAGCSCRSTPGARFRASTARCARSSGSPAGTGSAPPRPPIATPSPACTASAGCVATGCPGQRLALRPGRPDAGWFPVQPSVRAVRSTSAEQSLSFGPTGTEFPSVRFRAGSGESLGNCWGFSL
jgi:hypothetical protein